MSKLLRYFFPVLFAVLFLSTCIVTSIHPIYNDEDIVFNKKLLGTWVDDDSNKWVIAPFVAPSFFSEPKIEDSLVPVDYKTYDLELTDSEGVGKFIFHLAEISGDLFIDFYPFTSDLKENMFLSFHRLPVHSFGLIDISDNVTVIRLLKYEWFENLVKETPDAIKFEKSDSHLIITAGTEEIQEFLVKYKDNKEAFSDSIVLNR